MGVERASGEVALVDVLDRVLDKGIVIEGWVRVSLIGIELVTFRGTVVVRSIGTYLKDAGYLKDSGGLSRTRAGSPRDPGKRRNVSAAKKDVRPEKDQHSPAWLHQLLEGLQERPTGT